MTGMDALKENSATPGDFEDRIESVRPRLRAFLLSLTGSECAADDLTQDTCLVLWEKRDEFDPDGNFRAWAFRIGFLRAQNHRRKQSRRRRRELPGDELFDRIAESVTMRHGDSDRDEAREAALATCLGKLNEDHRDLVLSRYQDGRSLQQLSDDAGIKRNAMAQKLFRLKRKLLQCLEKQLPPLHRVSPTP